MHYYGYITASLNCSCFQQRRVILKWQLTVQLCSKIFFTVNKEKKTMHAVQQVD